MRALCQVLLIIWYPFLCCWPSGIVLYMFCNSIISILQASLMKSVWFQSKLNKKVMHYNYMLSTV
jgi:membrane protein insertase Oxa1/YidC/SpoIIIJ